MFERFTDRSRRVVVLAQEQARLLKHHHIGTEHLVLGLIQEGEGIAAQVLTDLGIRLEEVKDRVRELVPSLEEAATGHVPFTPRAKKVLERSLREALQLGHSYVGTEHVLLGVCREASGVGVEALALDVTTVREAVIEKLRGFSKPESTTKDESAERISDDPEGFLVKWLRARAQDVEDGCYKLERINQGWPEEGQFEFTVTLSWNPESEPVA